MLFYCSLKIKKKINGYFFSFEQKKFHLQLIGVKVISSISAKSLKERGYPVKSR